MKTFAYVTSAVILLMAGVWTLLPSNSAPGPVTVLADGPGGLQTPAPFHSSGADPTARRVLGPEEAEPFYSSPSPDGSRLAFVDWARYGDMAVRDLRTGEIRYLTDTGSWDEYGGFGAFSPDGRKLAYEWYNGSRGVYEIRVMDLATDEVRVLFSPDSTWRQAVAGVGSWSPDGRWLAATLPYPDRTTRITLIRINDGHRETLRSLEWAVPGRPVFSPDGQWLAYDLPRETPTDSRDIHLLARDGSRSSVLVRNAGHDRVVGWLPDADRFLYLTEDERGTRLLAADVTDGRKVSEPRALHSELWTAQPLGLAGDALFYATALEVPEMVAAPFDGEAGTLTGPQRPLISDRPLGSRRPSERIRFRGWSPDGARIAYSAQDLFSHSGTTFPPERLVVRSLPSGAERPVDMPLQYVYAVDWSSQADLLAIQALDEQGRAGIHVLDLDDGGVTTVARGVAGERSVSFPRWATDGTLYLVIHDQSTDPATPAVIRLDPETGLEKELLRLPGQRIRGFAPSPDGESAAVIRALGDSEDWEIVVAPFDGGEPRRVVHVGAPEWIRVGTTLDWTPDGERLVYVRGNMEDGSEQRTLWTVRRDGSEDRLLVSVPMAQDVRIHPRGDRIALTSGEPRFEIWALGGLGRAGPVAGPDR